MVRFHSKVPLDLSDEICEKSRPINFFQVAMAGGWPSNASVTLFFLISQSTTIEPPIAFRPDAHTTVGMVQASRSAGVDSHS